jgi:putative nucleotidyltransferase with HDIG domain
MGRRSLRFTFYAWSVTVIAACAVAWALRSYHLDISWELTGLAVAAVAAELLAVNLKRGGGISLMYPLAVSGIVLLGPMAGVVITAASSLPYMLPGRIRPVSKTVFNASQLVLMALVPGALYLATGGRPLARYPLATSGFPAQILPLLLAAWVGVLVNVALVGVGYGLLHDVPMRRVWREIASWMLPSQLALGLVGLAIAQVLSDQGAMGFALFVIPLIVARQMHQRTLSLRDAYADTVRSLVGAIEAKDPYTKGHSVRVAEYAVCTAKELGFDDGTIERLERAALLHDVGKVGVSRSILCKPEKLTQGEYEEIRQHPDIAAHILESAPHLADVVEAVRHHHERFDGAGYGGHLVGEQIPIEARILAVADSYDAMTSERAYRSALSPAAALAELAAGRGTQFDAEVVDVFLEALARAGIGDSAQTPIHREAGPDA